MLNVLGQYHFQIYALQLFSAFRSVLSMAVKTNTKDLIRLIGLIAQLSPAKLWAEAMHASGLFSCLLKDLIDDKVCSHIFTSQRC